MNAKKSYFNKKIFTRNIIKLLPVIIPLAVIYTFFTISIIKNCLSYNLDAFSFPTKLTKTIEITLKAVYFEYQFAPEIQISLIVFSFICAVVLFNYLYSPKLCTTIHSLPIRREAMFITNIVSGIVVLAIPFLVAHTIVAIYLAYTGLFNLSMLASIFLIQLAYCFIFFSIAVLAIMFTGHLWAAPCMFGFLNIVFFACENLIKLLLYNLLFGTTIAYDLGHIVFTPALYLYKQINLNNNTGNYTPDTFKALGIYLAVSIVLLVISFVLYKKRALETQGEPIVFKKAEPFFHYMTTLITSIIATTIIWSIIYYDYSSTYISSIGKVQVIVMYLILSVIIFYVLKMLFNKTIKVFNTKNIGLFVYIGISIVVFAITYYDVFGVEHKYPSIDSVDSLTIESYQTSEFTTTNKEAIAEYIELHKDFIDAKNIIINKKEMHNDENYGHITLSYSLKNGKKLTRQYNFHYAEKKQTADDKKLNKLNEEILNIYTKYDIILEQLNHIDNIGSISLYSTVYNEKEECTDSSYLGELEKVDAYRLIEALKMDASDKESQKHIYNDIYYITDESPKKNLIYEIDCWYNDNNYLMLYVDENAKNTVNIINACKPNLEE